MASTNKKDKTIREYNKKNHYNDWLFMYDPTSDRGALLVGPWQTPTTSTIQGASPIGQPGGLGNQQSQGFGQQNTFGQPNNGQSSNSNSFGQNPQNQNQNQNPQQ